MPIEYTTYNSTSGAKLVEVKYLGLVVEVKNFEAQRNWSDTLDYSDYRTTMVTQALVYVGRTCGKFSYKEKTLLDRRSYAPYAQGEEFLPIDRFTWVDCTNLFVDRGAPFMRPWVDDVRHPDVVIDYIEFIEAMRAHEAALGERRTRDARVVEARNEEEKRNRPAVGKQMVVASGRKVKPGTLGTVAYVHASGRVLLKKDAEWQDRKAQGEWIDPRHLKAR